MRRLLGFSIAAVALSFLLLASIVGCGDSRQKSSSAPARQPSAVDAQADEHEHGDHDEHAEEAPHSFAEGVAALQKHYEAIKTAYTQGEAEKAHEPLHQVGSVLEALPELGQQAGLAATDLEKLKQSVEKMFEAYGNIDDAVHQGKEADYQAVAEQVDQHMTAIRSLLATPPAGEKK
jgi:uncharacterized protein YukE